MFAACWLVLTGGSWMQRKAAHNPSINSTFATVNPFLFVFSV